MKNKYIFLMCLVFMVVGYASVSTTLSLSNNTDIANILSEFDVYFSDVKINGEQNYSPVEDSNTLIFAPDFSDGDYVLEYDVTNSSKNYDADVEVICTSDNNNVSIKNEFSNSVLEATETRKGKVTVSGSLLKIGDEVTIANEKFNVINFDDTNVSLLAKLPVQDNYRQADRSNDVVFSKNSGWVYKPGPKEIDIQSYDGSVKTILNGYVNYIKTQVSDSNLSGTLITVGELKALDCVGVRSDYVLSQEGTCVDSPYIDWLANGYYFWTRSAVSDLDGGVWGVDPLGILEPNDFDGGNYGPYSVRPVINTTREAVGLNSFSEGANITCKLSFKPAENKELGNNDVPAKLEKCVWLYTDSNNNDIVDIGDEYVYCNERFNVTKVDGDDVTLLAKYNIGTNYRQSLNPNYVSFSNVTGWEYTPGPKEIDIQTWGTEVKRYVNNYVTFLQVSNNDPEITGNIITIKELVELGCTFPKTNTYSYSDGETCLTSSYADWLVNNQYFWTRSAYSGFKSSIWYVHESGEIKGSGANSYLHLTGVRPSINVKQSTLNNEVLSEADIFCRTKGFSDGMLAPNTSNSNEFEQGDVIEYYICSDSEDFEEYYGYDENGDLITINGFPASNAEKFCVNNNYKYGMDYIQTYQGGDYDEYLMPSYRCTNDADYKTYDYYAIDGTLLYKFTGGIDPYIPEG